MSPMPQARMALRVLNGDLQGQVFRVDGSLVVGRSTSCALFIPDRRISREHARFSIEENRFFVEDLQSHNGTHVNGQRVTRAELFGGDLVRLGTSQFAIEAVAVQDSAVVRVVSDTQSMQPRVVKPVEQSTRSALALGTMGAGDFFSSIGVGDTDRFASLDRIENLRQKTRSFAILYEVSKTLQRYTDLRETLPVLVDLLLEVVGGSRGAVVLFDADGNLVPSTVRYADKQAAPEEMPAMTMSKTVADWVLQERCGVITADAATDSRFSASESVVLNKIRSLLVVPVLVGNRSLGLIEIENSASLAGFDENDLDLTSIVASMIGIALDHLEMSQARERAIAQLQAAQEQLIATQERLVDSERMGMLGRLASGIAHEVKNHLSPFMLADMIADKYKEDQEIQESAELMLEAQQRILGLVDEIRLFAGGAQSAGHSDLCDLCNIITGVLRFVRCDRAVKAAEIVFEPRERPIVFADAHRIRQVLINLIRNAADALSSSGGRIDIRVSTVNGHAVIDVADNGRGIPAAIAGRVFEPFFSTKGDKGLGLGLDISRQIAIAHGGTLSFESEEGKGTVFRLTLPPTPPDKRAPPYDDMNTDPHGTRTPLSVATTSAKA